ncbi:MAG: glutaredoxin family protein [Chlorobi bacterium]|nr:glutaredoxin family protein [Chlorobiota bacterium]
MIKVSSLKDFKEKTAGKENFWLLIYKKSSPQSDCAKKNIDEALQKDGKADVFTADVNEVRDIHPEYSVTSVPSLLKFEKSEFKGIFKGCSDVSFYESLFAGNVYSASSSKDSAAQKSVIVYSTPTCSWCNRLKSYLRENNIKFRDIDVSKDQKAAEDMVKRSGQQGVPQSIIGGQVIVGFDKAKIDKLLGL